MADVTKIEAEAVLAEQNTLTANLNWRPHGRGFRLDSAQVLALESGNLLRLTGYLGSSNRSFALLYKNLPIRKYTVHSSHRNPDGTVTRGPHKHTWDDVDEDRWTYVPDDITQGNPMQELLDFLKECNIQVMGDLGLQGLFPWMLGVEP